MTEIKVTNTISIGIDENVKITPTPYWVYQIYRDNGREFQIGKYRNLKDAKAYCDSMVSRKCWYRIIKIDEEAYRKNGSLEYFEDDIWEIK